MVFARLALGAPAVAAVPRNVRVVGVSVLGSGCPHGTAEVKADASNTVFDIRLSDYVVQSGPNTMAADWRKNCKLTLNLQYDAGFQFATLAADMSGYAVIPSGAKGQCSNTVDFTGSSSEANYDIALEGGAGAFSLSANPDLVLWSPCGGSTAILNMNTQCSVSPPEKSALIAVDRITSRLAVRLAIQWRTC
ncbi:hypothetical protein C8A05DRAFT_20358 [Staphylotrichum tortipilum]|uniref:Secreted protein n=1 Tax=Staphylotrichum tortipilum TaxID=2831512 RepID=A0AAN6M9F3_9PEZI|nr:hypothetical protein C8A05DRAFT_20358 [Staphylotrichum longicolle]